MCLSYLDFVGDLAKCYAQLAQPFGPDLAAIPEDYLGTIERQQALEGLESEHIPLVAHHAVIEEINSCSIGDSQ